MKKVIIISDSHGNLDNVRKIVEKEKNYDMVIHLGDLIGQDDLLKEICKCEIKCVRGNCDLMSENPLFDDSWALFWCKFWRGKIMLRSRRRGLQNCNVWSHSLSGKFCLWWHNRSKSRQCEPTKTIKSQANLWNFDGR